MYFFSGSGVLDGLSQPRKIQPKGFQSFGFSLTILEDLDGNGCKGIFKTLSFLKFIHETKYTCLYFLIELAVGSPKDNKVVIFKTIAFIKVILKADLNQEVRILSPEILSFLTYLVRVKQLIEIFQEICNSSFN